MERIRRIFERGSSDASYEPLEGGSERLNGEHIEVDEQVFSWTDYSVFVLLGVAMLWAWNMFLAATPYFQRRFSSDDAYLRNFQSAILSVSTVGNLSSMIVLTKLQARANYPKRITVSLALTAIIFTLLALSTKLFLSIGPGVYFAFLMVTVLSASLATGMCQNGVFAYVSGFGLEEYTQGIMVGQGIAGVLPAITQIATVLAVPSDHHTDNNDTPQESSTSAFIHFITAAAVSLFTLLAFFYLLSRCSSRTRMKAPSSFTSPDSQPRKTIPLTHLFRKLAPLASAVFLTFAITMFFPVFTGQILSTRDPATSPRLFQPASFIPLAFLAWNAGDLLGRLAPALPTFRLTHRPKLLLLLSVLRIVFIPLYMLNKNGVVKSDFFYLAVVQLGFGISNGFLGSNCMMGFAEWVLPEEREAASGFMSLCLVGGLAVGSFASFAVAG